MFATRANVPFTIGFTINRLIKFLYCPYQCKIQIQNILVNIYSHLLWTVYSFEEKYLEERVINVFSFPMWARFFSETHIMARRNRSLSATSITSETCQNCIAHYLRERGISKNAFTFKRRIVEGKRSTRRRSASSLAAPMLCYAAALIRYKDSRQYFAGFSIAYKLRTGIQIERSWKFSQFNYHQCT